MVQQQKSQVSKATTLSSHHLTKNHFHCQNLSSVLRIIMDFCDQLKEELRCSICLDLPSSHLVTTSCCSHVFCSTCIQSVNGSTCPLCRQPLRTGENPWAERILKLLNSHLEEVKKVEESRRRRRVRSAAATIQTHGDQVCESSFVDRTAIRDVDQQNCRRVGNNITVEEQTTVPSSVAVGSYPFLLSEHAGTVVTALA